MTIIAILAGLVAVYLIIRLAFAYFFPWGRED